jgi:hypothetical protein
VRSVIGRAAAIAAAGVLVLSAIAISLVLFALALTAAVAFGVWYWWKTRRLRSARRSRFDEGDVVDGVVIREVEIRRIERW